MNIDSYHKSLYSFPPLPPPLNDYRPRVISSRHADDPGPMPPLEVLQKINASCQVLLSPLLSLPPLPLEVLQKINASCQVLLSYNSFPSLLSLSPPLSSPLSPLSFSVLSSPTLQFSADSRELENNDIIIRLELER